MIMVVLLRSTLILIDFIDFERGQYLYSFNSLILILDKLHTKQVVFDINGYKINKIRLIVDFLADSSQNLSFPRNLLNPKMQFLFHSKRIGSDYLIFLHDINIRIDSLVQHCHKCLNSTQIQTTTG